MKSNRVSTLPRSVPSTFAAAAAAAVMLLLFLIFPSAGRGVEVVLTTDNDFLGANEVQDDLYTFSLELSLAFRGATLELRENAFTDRDAGLRFDETELVVGRVRDPGPRGWQMRWEAGVTHVGRGIFGQSVQNAFHDLIGGSEVDLEYVDSSKTYPLVLIEFGRQKRLASRISAGPSVLLKSSFGFKSEIFVGIDASWRLADSFAVRARLGPKWSDSSRDLLHRHLHEVDVAAELSVRLPRGFEAAWAHNRYGTGRQHVSLSYHVAGAKSRRE